MASRPQRAAEVQHDQHLRPAVFRGFRQRRPDFHEALLGIQNLLDLDFIFGIIAGDEQQFFADVFAFGLFINRRDRFADQFFPFFRQPAGHAAQFRGGEDLIAVGVGPLEQRFAAGFFGQKLLEFVGQFIDGQLAIEVAVVFHEHGGGLEVDRQFRDEIARFILGCAGNHARRAAKGDRQPLPAFHLRGRSEVVFYRILDRFSGLGQQVFCALVPGEFRFRVPQPAKATVSQVENTTAKRVLIESPSVKINVLNNDV